MELQSTAKATFSKRRVGLIGPPGSGKTTTAASISAGFEKKNLSDVLWFLFDDGGLDSLTSRGIVVPKYFDFTSVNDEKTLNADLKAALATAKNMASSGDVKAIVFDTITALNRRWFTYGVEKFGKQYGLYDEIGMKNMRFYMEVMTLPCDVLLLFQPKPKPEGQNDNLAVSKFEQVLDIPGAHGNIYRENLAIWTIQKEVAAGKKQVWIYPNGHGGVEGKDRYDLPDKVEPDLRKIFEQVKAKAAA
ncbi:MAG TPA: AAA family ATPase [Nitrososphaera sp.]|nr:AAA family ATPase [Nitrososphaera sp.]